MCKSMGEVVKVCENSVGKGIVRVWERMKVV